MGYVDGYDVWQYSGGDPINYFDPFGLKKGPGKGRAGSSIGKNLGDFYDPEYREPTMYADNGLIQRAKALRDQTTERMDAPQFDPCAGYGDTPCAREHIESEALRIKTSGYELAAEASDGVQSAYGEELILGGAISTLGTAGRVLRLVRLNRQKKGLLSHNAYLRHVRGDSAQGVKRGTSLPTITKSGRVKLADRIFDDFDQANKTGYEAIVLNPDNLGAAQFARKFAQLEKDFDLLTRPDSGVNKVVWFSAHDLSASNNKYAQILYKTMNSIDGLEFRHIPWNTL